VLFLLSKGADVNIASVPMGTPLQIARAKNFVDLVEILQSQGRRAQ